MDADKLRALQIDPNARERPRSGFWMFLMLLLVAAGVAGWYFWDNQQKEKRREGSGSGTTASIPGASSATSNALQSGNPASENAKRDGIVLTVSGYIVNRERIELSPRFMGQVKWIGVRKGDTVTNGQILVLLDDAEQRARVKEAEGRLANARATLTKAELDHQRISQLIADRIETQQAEDDARIHLESARAGVHEAEATLELNRTYL